MAIRPRLFRSDGKIAKLDETNKQVIGFADQLQSLQNILINPKQRGVLGEYYLETVLKNVLPRVDSRCSINSPTSDIVDAVIFWTKNKMLPIDSKFSLENYNKIINETNPDGKGKTGKTFQEQDLKNRIDETSKYIRPNRTPPISLLCLSRRGDILRPAYQPSRRGQNFHR